MPRKKTTKKMAKSGEKSREVVPYELGYLTDPRKIKAAQILAFSGWGAKTLAAKEANVNYKTINYWLTQDEFKRAVEEASKELAAHAANVIRKAIIKGDASIAKWYLERVLPKMFAPESAKQAIAQESMESGKQVLESIQFVVQETADAKRNAVEV